MAAAIHSLGDDLLASLFFIAESDLRRRCMRWLAGTCYCMDRVVLYISSAALVCLTLDRFLCTA